VTEPVCLRRWCKRKRTGNFYGREQMRISI
jgi:hypothetical protein